MVAQQVKRIDNMHKDLVLFTMPLGMEPNEIPALPIFHAIRNRVESLKELQNKMDLQKVTLRDAVETILLLDIDKVSQQDRKSYEIVMKCGQLTREVRKHLAFDPEYTVPKARSLSVVKATRDISTKFRKISEAYIPKDTE
jgi:hypothetical protein